jgi:hypothetical protein
MGQLVGVCQSVLLSKVTFLISISFKEDMRLSTSETTATEGKMFNFSGEVYAHSFNIINQLFEGIWSYPGALSMASVVERQNSVTLLQWQISSMVSFMAPCRPWSIAAFRKSFYLPKPRPPCNVINNGLVASLSEIA